MHRHACECLGGRLVDYRYHIAGMKVEPPAEHEQPEPKTCPWCKMLNSPSERFCQSCNAPLDPASAEKAAEKQRQKFQFIMDVFKNLTQGVSMEEALKDGRKKLEQLVG